MTRALEALRHGKWQDAALIIGGWTCLIVSAVMIAVIVQ